MTYWPYLRLARSIEMRFKFWLQPGAEECYHELLENGTSIYFMYEILNAHAHDSSIIAYFRNAYNGSIVAISTTPQRGHLEIIVNETCKRRRNFLLPIDVPLFLFP